MPELPEVEEAMQRLSKHRRKPEAAPDDHAAEKGDVVVIDFLGRVLKHVPASEWIDLCQRGLMQDRARQAVTPHHIVHAGERYFQKLPSITEPPVNATIEIVHEDEAIIVLNKPAPLPMHPGGRFNRNTLQYILEQVYYPQKPRPAHRLDANTTGTSCLGPLAGNPFPDATPEFYDAMARALRLPESVRIARDIIDAGNTSAASVPLALERMIRDGDAKPGDVALLIAFGAGLAYAAQVVTIP